MENLTQSEALCSRLRSEEGTLADLDAGKILVEMEALERSGTAFQNKHQYDVRLSYVAPVVVSVLMTLLMAGLLVLMIWGMQTDPEGMPPLFFMVLMLLIPLLVIGGGVLALLQRIGEIRKGEMDDARKY